MTCTIHATAIEPLYKKQSQTTQVQIKTTFKLCLRNQFAILQDHNGNITPQENEEAAIAALVAAAAAEAAAENAAKAAGLNADAVNAATVAAAVTAAAATVQKQAQKQRQTAQPQQQQQKKSATSAEAKAAAAVKAKASWIAENPGMASGKNAEESDIGRQYTPTKSPNQSARSKGLTHDESDDDGGGGDARMRN